VIQEQLVELGRGDLQTSQVLNRAAAVEDTLVAIAQLVKPTGGCLVSPHDGAARANASQLDFILTQCFHARNENFRMLLRLYAFLFHQHRILGQRAAG
jgi:hypothetical protein